MYFHINRHTRVNLTPILDPGNFHVFAETDRISV